MGCCVSTEISGSNKTSSQEPKGTDADIDTEGLHGDSPIIAAPNDNKSSGSSSSSLFVFSATQIMGNSKNNSGAVLFNPLHAMTTLSSAVSSFSSGSLPNMSVSTVTTNPIDVTAEYAWVPRRDLVFGWEMQRPDDWTVRLTSIPRRRYETILSEPSAAGVSDADLARVYVTIAVRDTGRHDAAARRVRGNVAGAWFCGGRRR
eukprot:PhM_4_TR3130/c0_g1_i2/m.9217